jgi:polysaccharide export outer membrane protein
LSIVAVAGLMAACASEPEAVPLPPVPVEQAEYRIGPGDTLQIYVWNHPDLNITVPVRPDGVISTPLVDNVKAEGKTAGQLAKDLEVALRIRAPKARDVTGWRRPTELRGGQAAQPRRCCTARHDDLDVMIASARRAGRNRQPDPRGRRTADEHPGAPQRPDQQGRYHRERRGSPRRR